LAQLFYTHPFDSFLKMWTLWTPQEMEGRRERDGGIAGMFLVLSAFSTEDTLF
jgi:hypothetical protein